jgi:serine/threonine protein kinase/tetratricopeptide (TPR) repeat protein
MNEESIFIEALQKDAAAARAAYLDAACAGNAELRRSVDALLRAYRRAGTFLEEAPGGGRLTAPASEGPGLHVGPYKILQQIGEGGMGVVFLAEQTEPVQRQVALKIIKPGMDSRQVIGRFEAERQALARMEHPHIATVLDAGTTAAGRPFFVMELVKGVPITRYCDKHRLTPTQRLELFLPVCHAVQHAHQKGIIHRDLKPSNILVAEYDNRPVPKIIDFGVAKATGPRLTERTFFTEVGVVVGTLEYMSPEQAKLNALDIDTRSDIYALGVLLYELLTGTTPFDRKRLAQAALDEVLRLIREEEPPRPSTRLSEAKDTLPAVSAQRQTEPARLAKLVKGELDWIVMKALEKDRDRRYETANDLAMDVHRYLRGEAVLAHPPSGRYRLRKFAHQHRQGLAITGMILTVLVAIVGAALWYQYDRAQARVERAVQLQYLEKEANTALDEAEQWREQLQQKLADPKDAARLLSNPEPWEMLLERSRAAWQRAAALSTSGKLLPGVELGDRLAALEQRLAADRQDYLLAKRLDNIRLAASTPIDSRWDRAAAALQYQAALAQRQLDFANGEPAQQAARIRQSPLRYVLVAALDHWAEVTPRNAPGSSSLLAAARLADPDPWRDQVRDPKHWRDPAKLRQLAQEADLAVQSPHVLLLLARRLEIARRPAAPLLRQALLHHPSDFWLHFNLGNLASDPGEQVACFRAALALRPLSVPAHMNLGLALSRTRDLDGAVRYCEKGIQLDPNFAKAHCCLGGVLRVKEDFDGAIAAYRSALVLDPREIAAHVGLGHALLHTKDFAGASRHYGQALEVNPRLTAAHIGLGNVLLATRDFDQAVSYYRKAIEIDPTISAAYTDLGIALFAQNDVDGAIAALRKAIELDPNDARPHNRLGNALLEKDDLDGAGRHYRKAITLDPAFASPHNGLGDVLTRKNDPAGALTHYRMAVELDAKDIRGYVNLAVALRGKKDNEGAIVILRKALAINPRHARANYLLGNALRDKNDLQRAAAAYRKAIEADPHHAEAHCNLGHALRRQGEFHAALAMLKQGHALGIKQPDWKYQSERWVQTCERLLELDQKLSEVLKGERRPSDGAELVELADLCLQYKKRPATAADWYAAAFAKDSRLAVAHRYNAARAAALAAAELPETDKARRRAQALAWLKAELPAVTNALSDAPRSAAAQKKLQGWLTDPELAGVRHPQALSRLAEAERASWQQLWNQVQQLLQQRKEPIR